MYPATATTNATYELPKLDPRRRNRAEKESRAVLTGVLGNISASSFLYRLTGRRELGRSAGQHTHMLSHDGRGFAGRNPIFRDGPDLTALRSVASRRQDTAARPPASADQSFPPNALNPAGHAEKPPKPNLARPTGVGMGGGNLGREGRGVREERDTT